MSFCHSLHHHHPPKRKNKLHPTKKPCFSPDHHLFSSIKRPNRRSEPPTVGKVLQKVGELFGHSFTFKDYKVTQGDTELQHRLRPGVWRCRFVDSPMVLMTVFFENIARIFNKKSSLTSWILVELTMWFGFLKLLQHFPWWEQHAPRKTHHIKAIGNFSRH